MSLMLALPLAQLGVATLPAPPAPTEHAAPASPAPATLGETPAPSPATPVADTAPTEPPPAPAPAPAHAPDQAQPPRPSETTADPLHGFNRLSYAITQPIDALVLRPIALVYITVLPETVRDGLRNALDNLATPMVLANDLLQLRPDRAGRTILRFAINSTLGMGGLFDIAKRPPFNLPAHTNGFGDTLGYHGMGPGAYVYLPVLGPTTLRDMVGLVGDAFTEPLLLDYLTGKKQHAVPILRKGMEISTYGLATMVASGIDTRAQNDQALKALKTQSVDPYAALRASYLQDRAGQIAALKAKAGAPAQIPAFDDPLEDPAAGKP